MDRFKANRDFMKSKFGKDLMTDQKKQIDQPDLVKEYDEEAYIINLPKANENILKKNNLHQCIEDRATNRVYTDEIITIDELAYLLWASQGVKSIKGDQYATIRTVASAGARHPFETYLAVNRVEGLRKGLYRYLPLEHQLMLVYEEDQIEEKIIEGTLGQKFAGKAAVNFIWTAMPYRTEWRYDSRAHKVMLIDAGHICQNLYLASEALGLGACAIAAYDQELMDKLSQVDGNDEFVVYMAPVGRV